MRNYALIFLVVFGCCSCAHDRAEPAVVCSTPDTVSFSRDLIPLFAQNCNDAGCHSGSSAAANLNLDAAHAYAALHASGSGYIDTINPKYSLLYAQMNSVSNPMPPSGKLDKCKLEMVLRWIEQKAKNN